MSQPVRNALFILLLRPVGTARPTSCANIFADLPDQQAPGKGIHAAGYGRNVKEPLADREFPARSPMIATRSGHSSWTAGRTELLRAGRSDRSTFQQLLATCSCKAHAALTPRSSIALWKRHGTAERAAVRSLCGKCEVGYGRYPVESEVANRMGGPRALPPWRSINCAGLDNRASLGAAGEPSVGGLREKGWAGPWPWWWRGSSFMPTACAVCFCWTTSRTSSTTRRSGSCGRWTV